MNTTHLPVPTTSRACTACWVHQETPGGPSCVSFEEWPIVVMTSAGGDTPAQQDCRIQIFEQLLARNEVFALVIESKGGGGRNRDTRVQDWMRANEVKVRKLCAGVGLVLPSTIFRFVISTFLLTVREPAPFKPCKTLGEAKAWCRVQLASHGR